MFVHKHSQATQLEHHKVGQLEVSSGNPSYVCTYMCPAAWMYLLGRGTSSRCTH